MDYTPPPDDTPAKRALNDIRAAIAFLTRLPINAPHFDLARACWAFPVAGLLVGLAAGVVFASAHYFGLPAFISALLALLTGTILTGALHEDGLADTADGLAGSDPDRRLKIKRERHIGAYGVLALIFSVGLRTYALAATAETGFSVLISAAILSRGLLPTVMFTSDLASDSGLAAAAGKPERNTVLLSVGLASAGTVAILGPAAGIGALIFGMLGVGGIALLAKHLLGGYNGDTLGAAQQSAEIAVLLFLVASL